MRITEHTNADARVVSKSVTNNSPIVEKVVKQGSEATDKIFTSTVEQVQTLDNSEETRAKVQEAVNKMNEMLEVNHSTSKFMYHDGLERYYVTVVNKDTDEVVKEIPPKKLLDAFYEMQKMLGMIVDEKI
ncbi:flagellar protein FlaG [Lysinibacillus sp. LZ02]|uniref:flagellar protein FlaG n=1 Tax=Lysinibacillus sp. LZ02 TaxID=3420668 RepID=UPI003D3602CF